MKSDENWDDLSCCHSYMYITHLFSQKGSRTIVQEVPNEETMSKAKEPLHNEMNQLYLR